MVTGLLAERACGPGVRFKAHRSGNEIAEGVLAGVPVTVARPRSYMNLSGRPVAALSAFYKVPPARIMAVHDELDLPFGSVRLKLGGGEGGHNGLRSISKSLGTRDYLRVRCGIGRPPGRQDPADFVLRGFSTVERKELDLLLERAADAAEGLVERGLEWTQNAFHPET
jgi:PTH1 family peptidyl-tRNA hydrolase